MPAKYNKQKRQKAQVLLKPLKPSTRLVEGVALSLCQAMVPRPLFEAARAQMEQDNLGWRDVVRWALVEYLVMRNPANGREVWSRCV